MKSKKTITDYWFTIEPYVYINVVNNQALLYNTLNGDSIESANAKVLELIRAILQKENCGVVLLSSEQYQQQDISDFICELRKKYMGDIIDVSLSKAKPIQLLPYFNLQDKQDLYKKHNFSPHKKILDNLSEISIHVDNTTNITKLISFLESVSGNLTFNIIGNLGEVNNYKEVLTFLNGYDSPKNIQCSYKSIVHLQPDFNNNFSYIVCVRLPMDELEWNNSKKIILKQALPTKYIFDVCFKEEYQQIEQLIKEYKIDNYQIKPIYCGDNIDFFKENVFLMKDDILSGPVSIKDIFANQALNIYDFGKINIMPNGDVYANMYHPILGNIATHSIYELVYREIEEGESWMRVRNQAPCDACVYQWLCPPPSNYELSIGKPNLCHVNKE